MEIKFNECEKSLSKTDIIHVEKRLDIKLPNEFKMHYLKYNGGRPNKTLWVDKKGKIEDLEIRDFISLLFNRDFKDDPVFSQPERIIKEWAERKVPKDLIPFAYLWKLGYICLNISDYKIYYFDRRSKPHNSILISESFQDFLDSLQKIEPIENEEAESVLHKFWGEIDFDWAGPSAGKSYKIRGFKKKKIELFLGEEFDEEGDEIEDLPTKKQLDSFEKTFSSFLENIDDILDQIKEETFKHYKKFYASHYEDTIESGEKPLNINTKEKHFKYIQDVNFIRVLKRNTLKIPIRYDLDTEHGIEIKIRNNKIIAIGGIAET